MGGVAAASLLCYGAGCVADKTFLKKLTDCTKDSCLCPEPTLMDKIVDGAAAVVNGLADVGDSVLKSVASVPGECCKLLRIIGF